MAIPLWKLDLQPASYNGAGFHVEVNTRAGGRRIANHEYPKRDIPYAEDMGRKSRRFSVTGYVISGPLVSDYTIGRDALIDQLEIAGPGRLVLPTGLARAGENRVTIENYSVAESRERGGIATFEMIFLEFGVNTSTIQSLDTQGQVTSSVNPAVSPTGFMTSSDITRLQ
jgi:prophage DNA circulation protein